MDSFTADIQKYKKHIIELKREDITAEIVRGIVLDYSPELVLLANIDDNFYINGYIIVRNNDITAYRFFDSPDSFFYQAQKELHLFPDYSFKIDLTNIRSVCLNIHQYVPLVTIFKEKSEDVCYIGHITTITDHSITLYEIDSDAEWETETRFYLRKISRIDFGGGYENALWLVGKKDLPTNIQSF